MRNHGHWILLLAALAACSTSSDSGDASIQVTLEPERRFGNDPELVSDFANLKTCVYRAGRLDRSCAKLKVLQRRLRVKARRADRRKKVVTTLANLLESRRELTRLVAADSLFPHRRAPKIVSASRAALGVEQAPPVKATMLRQVCWKPDDWARRTALELLAPTQHSLVQAEAASCLGRFVHDRTHREVAIRALVAALDAKRPRQVRGNACAALGALGATEAAAAMAALLEDPRVAWRCASPLAQLGSRPAFASLLAATRKALKGGKLPTQYVTALTSFADRPFFDKERILALLADIAGRRKLGWIPRLRAVRELSRLGGQAQLRTLRALYARHQGEGDREVLAEINRQVQAR